MNGYFIVIGLYILGAAMFIWAWRNSNRRLASKWKAERRAASGPMIPTWHGIADIDA